MASFLSPDVGEFIEVDGECYYRGEEETGTPDLGTVTGVFESCEDCVSGAPSSAAPSTAPSVGASSTAPSAAPSAVASSAGSDAGSSLPSAPEVSCPAASTGGLGSWFMESRGGVADPPYSDSLALGLAADTQLGINRDGLITGDGISARSTNFLGGTLFEATPGSVNVQRVGYRQFDTTIFDWVDPVAIQLEAYGDYVPGTTGYLFYTTGVVNHGSLTLDDILTGWTNGGALPDLPDGASATCRDIRTLVPNSTTLTIIPIDEFTLNGGPTGLVSAASVRLTILGGTMRGTLI